MSVLLAQGVEGLGTIIAIGAAIFVLFFMLIVVAVFANYFRLWIQSFLTGAGITIWDLIGMTFRKVNKDVIVKSKIMAVQAGLDEDEGITSKALEAHALAGGNVPLVIRSLIAAKKAKIIRLSFREATAIDLAGRNVLEAVQTSVYPKVIDCPGRGGQTLDAIARNGIQLKVRARVTVRANLQRVIGGATEETIIARVGEGIVSAIGKADDHMRCWRIRTRSPPRCSAGSSTPIPPSRSSRSTSPTSTWAKTSALGCGPIRPRPTLAWPGPAPKAAGRPRSPPSRNNTPGSKRAGPSWWNRKRKCPRRWPIRSAPAGWASWTITSSATCKPTPTCGGPSPGPGRRQRRRGDEAIEC